MKIWIINDDPYDRDAELEIALEVFPQAEVSTAESFFDIRGKTVGPDILICDISAVGPIGGGAHQCYGPICSFHEKYPGAVIMINSAVSSFYAMDVVDLVKERCPDAVVCIVEWLRCDPYGSLRKLLQEYKCPTQKLISQL